MIDTCEPHGPRIDYHQDLSLSPSEVYPRFCRPRLERWCEGDCCRLDGLVSAEDTLCAPVSFLRPGYGNEDFLSHRDPDPGKL